MNPLAALVVFSFGVSVGIIWGRRDERKRAAVAAVAADEVPVPSLSPKPTPTPTPIVADTAAAMPVPAAVEEVEGAAVEPAVARALGREPLVPEPPPSIEITKKGKKLGFDESTFTPTDDILDRLRKAEELGVDAERAKRLLGEEEPAAPARPEPLDPSLADRERRVLDRLRAQQPEGEADG